MFDNPIVFWELAASDEERSVAFFRQAFDWKIEYSEKLGFYLVLASDGEKEGAVGGIFTPKRARLPFVALYIQVADIEQKVRLVEELGGLIVLPPESSPSGGSRVCLFNEPSGVTFAMIQSEQESTPLFVQDLGDQPNPVVWWELASSNTERSVTFFQKAFDWRIEHNKGAGFPLVFGWDGETEVPVGGIFTPKRARLPFVSLYIRVEDIEQKAALVEELGGLIILPPEDTPGGRSRLCLFNEPSGVTFALIASKEEM